MPRINATLSPDTLRALKRYAAATDQSTSSTVAEILDLVAPSLGAACDALERAKHAPLAVAQGLLDALRDVAVAGAARGVPDADRLLQALAGAGNPLAVSEAPEAPAGAGGLRQPPSSNTGVRSVDNSGAATGEGM